MKMAHLMGSTANMPGFVSTHEPVGVGSMVVYHGRTGHMRQGRTKFPAIVFEQHPDDGSLELLVLFEPEDQIWERRVLPYSDINPGHCWSPIEAFPIQGLSVDAEGIEALSAALKELKDRIFGQWQEPPKAVMDYLADFDGQLSEFGGRLKLIEAKLGLVET